MSCVVAWPNDMIVLFDDKILYCGFKKEMNYVSTNFSLSYIYIYIYR